MFPVEVSCTRCGRSLMDSTHPVDGFPSIHVLGKHGRKTGDIWLSSLYGSFKGKESLNLSRGTEVDILCPECNELLSNGPPCLACEARTVILEMPRGGMIRFCSRFGCRKHSIAFGDIGEVVVSSVMNRYIVSLYASDSIISAIETLLNYEISAVPVLNEDESLIGLLTIDKIIALTYPDSFLDGVDQSKIEKNKDAWKSMRAGEIALKNPPSIGPEASLPEAASLMIREKINTLLVMKEGVLVGLLTKTDLARAMLREKIG